MAVEFHVDCYCVKKDPTIKVLIQGQASGGLYSIEDILDTYPSLTTHGIIDSSHFFVISTHCIF